MRTINDSLAEAIRTEEVITPPAPQDRLFEWNEIVAIVSEFVWRDVHPLDYESEHDYRSRLNTYAEQEVLKIMYAPSPEHR
jgi:hypothetical protein